MMEEQMRKIGRSISIKMAVTMSFFLSLVGNLTSGHFTLMGFLTSFLISLVISMVIGLLIPIGKLGGAACRAAKLRQGTLGARLMESLVSNLIFTPIMTLIMVFLAYKAVMKQSGGMAPISFGSMFLHSLIICFIVGYVLIFIVQPLFFKQAMKKYGKE
jgi:hypothetical protein